MAINFNPSINQQKNSSFRIKSPRLAKAAAKTMIALSTLTGMGAMSSCSKDSDITPDTRTETVLDRFTKGTNALGITNANENQVFDSVKFIDRGDTMLLKTIPEETTPTKLVVESYEQINNKMEMLDKSTVTGKTDGLLLSNAYSSSNNDIFDTDALGKLSKDTVKIYNLSDNFLSDMFVKDQAGKTIKCLNPDGSIATIYKILKSAVKAR